MWKYTLNRIAGIQQSVRVFVALFVLVLHLVAKVTQKNTSIWAINALLTGDCNP